MKMKRILSFFISILLLASSIPIGVNAEQSGYYTYTVSNDEATITSVDASIGGDITIPSVIDGCQVTGIESDAFYDCTSLTSVTVPDSVARIGERAFFGCSSLTEINVDPNNPNYSSDSGVLLDKDKTVIYYCASGISGEYIIPDSVKSIGYKAFSDCISLTSVTIPNSVTVIGDWAFSGCSSLASAAIPDSVKSIGMSAFSGCSSLSSVTIPDSVTSIDTSAFSACTSLTSVIIPDSVKSIEDWTFFYCTSLVSVTIPDSVTKIGSEAFRNCTALESVTIPDSVKNIGNGAFYFCSSLTDIYYTGTEDQWQTIEMAEESNIFENAVIHYSDGVSAYDKGDVNGDRQVDIKDSCMIKRIILFVRSFSAEELNAADMDGNGRVDTRDAFLLKRRLLLGSHANITPHSDSTEVEAQSIADENAEDGFSADTAVLPLDLLNIADTDCSGKINSGDAIWLFDHINDEAVKNDTEKYDLNGDGAVTKDDASYLMLCVLIPEKYELKK